jgi:hypothetical protein
MKKLLFITTLMTFFTLSSSAESSCQKKEEWKQKMMSEKIAFLTNEMGITPEESQTFWPVYNQLNKEKDESMHKVFENYRKLSEAVEAGKTGKEVEKLLDAYLDAQKSSRDIENDMAEKLMKVLPVEKVAKLYLAEERFRRHQIHRLHEGKKQER